MYRVIVSLDHTHETNTLPVELPWTNDRPATEASTYINTKQTHAPEVFEPANPVIERPQT